MDINDLHKRAQSGDKTAEEHLFRSLRDRFALIVQHRISDRDACHDVIQDALTVIAERHMSITFESSFAAWAYRVLENKTLQYYRQTGADRKRLCQIGAIEHQMATDDVRPETRRMLLHCLKSVVSVNRRFARVLNLHHQGYSINQISERMGSTKFAVYNLLSRGRKMLRECLQKRRGKR